MRKLKICKKHCYLWVKDYEKEILYRCSSCGLQQVERKRDKYYTGARKRRFL